jgi:hypothetical protein
LLKTARKVFKENKIKYEENIAEMEKTNFELKE